LQSINGRVQGQTGKNHAIEIRKSGNAGWEGKTDNNLSQKWGKMIHTYKQPEEVNRSGDSKKTGSEKKKKCPKQKKKRTAENNTNNRI